MTEMAVQPPLTAEAFVARLREEGRAHYHDRHPFHLLMHSGRLSPDQLRQWVLNRYYYQTRIPIKDALILSKSEDPGFRRIWIRRIFQQDGTEAGAGGLALWLKLAEGVGLDPQEVSSCRAVLPGARDACDRYVRLVREWSLVEAVASSLTELFAPQLMSQRLAAWLHHYSWIDPRSLEYFRTRVVQAADDAEYALTFVVCHATTRHDQERCFQALTQKAKILWDLLDAIHAQSAS